MKIIQNQEYQIRSNQIDKESFQIGGFQKLSLLDYPGNTCSIIFTNGCNFKCPYCHNFEFVKSTQENSLFDKNEILAYLIKRKNVLDGLVISGGEPTIQVGLKSFIKEVKYNTNLKIKLDTNGTNPTILKNLIDENLVDYVAMDIKSDFENYSKITGVNNIDLDKIKKSIKIIKESSINYEFRTTIIKNYHNIKILENIIDLINDDSYYYLQKFNLSNNVPNKELKSFEDNELQSIYEELKKSHNKIRIRGIK